MDGREVLTQRAGDPDSCPKTAGLRKIRGNELGREK